MAALTRSNSRAGPPVYKDYVNFLASYKNGKKDDDDSGISDKSFSLTSSSSSISSDSTDFAKSSVTSYNAYLQNTKTKKFSSVKPKLEEKPIISSPPPPPPITENKEEKTIKKSEIYIEIQPTKSVSEVSKIFEIQKQQPPKTNKLNSKISIFEKQTDKPKFSKSPPAKIDIFEGQITPRIEAESPPPAKPPTPPPTNIIVSSEPQTKLAPSPPPLPVAQPTTQKLVTRNSSMPPPPPPPTVNSSPDKLQATLTKGPQTKFTVNNTDGSIPEIDRNNPLVKKLVYGTLRELYGAYHDKASDMLATLPKNMVVRSNGVQDRIEQIAANGDLEKLNGRVNPKSDQD